MFLTQYGLYTSIMGAFIYTLFGSSKDISIGPVAIISLLVAGLAQSPIPGDATYAILVSLVGGSIQLFMGLFRLGAFFAHRNTYKEK
jgi:solute carrier family 26 (sodium-independent sulfate anion transporter), member 11